MAQVGKQVGLWVSTATSSCGVCVPAFVSEKAVGDVEMDPYVWQATICAPADLWLINVDEDPRMTEWTTTAVTGYTLRIHPSDRLFVNEVYGRVWAWLYT